MKVLQLGKFYPIRGGVEKVMGDLTLGLGAQGVECDMLCACLPPQKPGIIQAGPNSRIICVPALSKRAATMISPSMVSYLREHMDYDIIHIHHPDPMAAMALYLSGYKGKVVLHWHSDILKQKVFLRFYLPLQSWLLKRADVVIGTSPVYLRESPYLKDCQDKAVSVPIGVSPVVADYDDISRVREKVGGKRIVLSLGRFVEYKGFGYLVDAVSSLPRDYVLVMGGEGPLREKIMGMASKNGHMGRVMFPGRIPEEELPSWIAACDVFVMSSVQKTEAFGVVQVEAMSIGKPIVATRIPGSGVSWVNEDGVSGINVPIKDSTALAEAIISICEDSEMYSLFSANSLRRYQEHFTLEKMIDACRRLYQSLV